MTDYYICIIILPSEANLSVTSLYLHKNGIGIDICNVMEFRIHTKKRLTNFNLVNPFEEYFADVSRLAKLLAAQCSQHSSTSARGCLPCLRRVCRHSADWVASQTGLARWESPHRSCAPDTPQGENVHHVSYLLAPIYP